MWLGGALELGESLEDAGIGEVCEETGINVKNLALFDVFSGKSRRHVYSNGDGAYNVSVAYLCTDFEGTPRPDSAETTDARFF